ncbi:MAG TPA: leucyl aminopeptidase [Terriglobia bacterium]|nr:leucyl aminopeptidase [Terriglobia bacterium]
MKIEFNQESVETLAAPVLAVCTFESNSDSSGTAALLPSATQALLRELQTSGELTGKAFECTLIHKPAGLAAQKLLVVGAGKRDKFDDAQLRRVAGTAVRFVRARSGHTLIWLLSAEAKPSSVQAAVEGAIVADYDADRYRTERNGEKKIDRFTLATGGAAASGEIQAAAERGRVIAEAQNFARELVNEPSNNLPPEALASRARAMAEKFALPIEVLDENKIQEMKMGALWAVGKGSETPPRMIVVRYEPADAPATPVVGLVGKGITFDTGGISIKPADAMHEMKTDMAGGATMLGVMQAIAQLKPRVRVIAIIPAAENMPSGRAYRPGDVITSMSGKTIEILNTDAEGRLALADGLTYAKQLGCTALIDAATLTGAVMIALGNITTGVFGWNQEWVGRVLASAGATGERAWQLPIDDEYRDLYKSMIADIANTGGRYGGAITAAMFVGEFAGDTPWAHLDIAGTRWSNEDKPYRAKGPTGVMIPTLVHLLAELAAKR